MKTYYISWYGPYRMENIYENDFGDNEKLYSNVLYMIAGKERYQRGPDEIKYIGITTNGVYYRFKNHHKAINVTRDFQVWIGCLDKSLVNKKDLELVESVLIYFTQTGLNEKKTIKPPKISCTVISRYYNKYYEVYKNQKSYLTMLPDVLMWRKEENKLFYASKLASYDIE